MSQPSSTVRLSVLAVMITSLFLALFARLLFLQAVESPKLAAQARANQMRTVYEEAPRGRIIDRNGHVLAGNRETDVVTVQRDALAKDPNVLHRLAEFLGADHELLAQRAEDKKASPYKPIPIAVGVDKALIASLRERQAEFPGVAAETQIQRWYPEGALAAHMLGYTGEANDRELAAHKAQGYRLGDQIGKAGIEAAYESDLRGKPGVDKIEVDSSGRAVRVVQHTASVPGRDVQLSIDVNVQRTAEEALTQGLSAARSTGALASTPAPAGSVVAVDPRDGSLLAMASYPSFDPARFSGGISASDYAQLTDPNGPLPLNNRAVQGQYAPGSTFKLLTAVAALRTNLITPETTITDGGVFTLGDRKFRNAQGRAYGTIALPRAMTVSSDVFFYSLGDRFWKSRKSLGDPIQSTARDFGFGAKGGLQIAGEAEGRVPDPPSRKKLHEQRPDVYPEGNWYAGDNVNLSIGQGDTLVTPLQLANAYGAFANGGTLYRPRLIAKVLDPNGKLITDVAPHVIRKIDLPPKVRDPIEQGLVGVVKDPRGTAHSAFTGFDLEAFSVAGKTGTAQVTGKQDSALFAGYGPVGDARVAVSVVLEQAGFGGISAAPVGRRVLAAVAGQAALPVALGTGED